MKLAEDFDLVDRLLPGALHEAYRDGRALTPEDLVDQAQVLAATPSFGGA